MSFDRKYQVWGLTYAMADMALGAFMGATHDHAQLDPILAMALIMVLLGALLMLLMVFKAGARRT